MVLNISKYILITEHEFLILSEFLCPALFCTFSFTVFIILILLSSFLYIKCHNPISSSIPKIPIDFLTLQYQFSLVSTFSPSTKPVKTKWNCDPYLPPIILSTLLYTRVYMPLNTWGFAFLQNCQFPVYMDGEFCHPHLHPVHHRIPFSSPSSFHPPPSP